MGMTYLPDTKKFDEKIAGETSREHLRDDEDVRCQRGFEHDGHVGGIEELDGV